MTDEPADISKITALLAAREYSLALERAQALVKETSSPASIMKLAEVCETLKNHEQALGLYKKLNDSSKEKSGTTDFGVALGLARCLVNTGKFDLAEPILERLVAVRAQDPEVLTLLAAVHRVRRQLDEAERFARAALEASPDFRVATFELARIHVDRQELDAAVLLLEKNIRRPDVHGDSIDLWLETLEQQMRKRYAQGVLEDLVKAHPDIVEFWFGLGVLAHQAGEISVARPAYQMAMQLSPNNPRILFEYGVLERIDGNLKKSQELIGQALALKPDNPAALRTYAADLKYSHGDENFRRLNYVAARYDSFDDFEKINLHYAMAKAFEDVDEMDTAFRHYHAAGEKKRRMEPYPEADTIKTQDAFRKYVTKAGVLEARQTGCVSDVPVFILGMPRSGTSLMEQILSSHPEIFGAGELGYMTAVLENIGVGGGRLRLGEKEPVFSYDANASWEERGRRYVEKVQALAGQPSKRIVDKMPGNFNFLGLIHAILPNARIIHSRRHPVETCLSCYRIHFAEGHLWSYNLRELGRYYRRYWELMKHWRAEFPGAMLEVRYEDNVADVESQARRLIAYLGLEWNENCLNFYNTDRPVKTASVTQVRKPIYTSSTNRWRRYEKYLEPLLEELGDIVMQYEAELETPALSI